MSRARLWFVLPLIVLVPACLGEFIDESSRNVTGQLMSGAYTLHDGAVVAQSSDGRVFVTSIDRDGRFLLTLPVGTDYRLMVAETQADGSYRTRSQIDWPTPQHKTWAHCDTGSDIDLGAICPEGTSCPPPPDGGAPASSLDLGTTLDLGSAGSDRDGGSPASSLDLGTTLDLGSAGSDRDGGSHHDCHQDDNATTCDPDASAQHSHCSGGAGAMSENVDHDACKRAEQQMRDRCDHHDGRDGSTAPVVDLGN